MFTTHQKLRWLHILHSSAKIFKTTFIVSKCVSELLQVIAKLWPKKFLTCNLIVFIIFCWTSKPKRVPTSSYIILKLARLKRYLFWWNLNEKETIIAFLKQILQQPKFWLHDNYATLILYSIVVTLGIHKR